MNEWACRTSPRLKDSDGDGLTDNAEQRGWGVTIVLTDGSVSLRDVTSDPFVADTDADGLNDRVEKSLATDPRSGDTDGDLIDDNAEFNVWFSEPTRQDTDSDGINDALEIEFFKTSPLLADTDGDGLEDGDEIVVGNRDPRISEPGITIGEVALRLDTRFAFTSTEGLSETRDESTSATLTQSDQQTFSTSDTETTTHVIEAGLEAGTEGGKAKVVANVGYTFTRENTFTASQESITATQQEFQESLSTSVTRDITEEVIRTVEGASIEVVVTISNFGDIPFSMSNVELTALLQDPFNRRRFVPVGTLLPGSMVDGGKEFQVALGPFIQERGPFIFKSTDVFPLLVEDLMKNPRGLIFKVANFDVTDEQGRNFAFISQDVNDRTAGLVIDFGDGTVDRFRIATHNSFDANGQPLGITMAYALQDILGLPKDSPDFPLPDDAITVGANGCAETFASGDDVQLVAPICLPVLPGGVIVEPGPNGVLDTIPVGDDVKSMDGLTIVDTLVNPSIPVGNDDI